MSAHHRAYREALALFRHGCSRLGILTAPARAHSALVGIAYRLPGLAHVGAVAITTYSSPAFDAARPLVHRIHVDHFELGFSRRSQAALELPPSRWAQSMTRQGPLALEANCLSDELETLASWLPLWLAANGAPTAPPPVEFTGPVKTYAWSARADATYIAWQRLENDRRSARLARLQ